MCSRDLTPRRGRPRASLIDDPAGARRDGERRLRQKLTDHERKVKIFGARAGSRPKQPTNELERGLIYAAHAGLVHPQAVPHILRRTRAFEAWMRTQHGDRGPAPDVEKAVQLYLALETITGIKAKAAKERGAAQPSGAPALPEIGDALELLFGAAPAPTTLKGRMRQLRPRLAEFESGRAAAKRQRQRTKRKKSTDAERA